MFASSYALLRDVTSLLQTLQMVQSEMVMQGLHLTGDSCHRLLARPAIPKLHRLHR